MLREIFSVSFTECKTGKKMKQIIMNLFSSTGK